METLTEQTLFDAMSDLWDALPDTGNVITMSVTVRDFLVESFATARMISIARRNPALRRMTRRQFDRRMSKKVGPAEKRLRERAAVSPQRFELWS